MRIVLSGNLIVTKVFVYGYDVVLTIPTYRKTFLKYRK